MIHIEQLRKADETYEIRHDSSGNAIHVYINDGTAIIFRTLHDLIRYVYFGESKVERFYALEDDLEFIYEADSYRFDELKDIFDFDVLATIRLLRSDDKPSDSEKRLAWAHLKKRGVADKINFYYEFMANEYIYGGYFDEKGNII